MGGARASAPGPSASTTSAPVSRLLLYVCFFLSGLTALVYQLLWFRELHHIFGSTLYSASAVLVGFMGGLGAGSLLIGRWADRHRSPAQLYGILELGVGLWALLTPALFAGVAHAYASLQGWLEWAPGPALLLKLLFSLPILLVPTVLMGGTLPTLARAMTRWDTGVHDELGRLYGVNTLGAMAGAALTGFVLLEALGTRSPLFLAAALNIGVGALIWLRVRRWEADSAPGADDSATPSDGSGDRPRPEPVPLAPAATPATARWAVRFATAGIAATGAASMLFELVWTRALAVLSGASAYSFTLVLTVVLAGLGSGGALYGLFARRRAPRALDYAFVLLLLALSAGITVPTLGLLPRWMLYLRQIPGLGFGDHMLVQFGVAALLLLPSTLLMGIGLPMAMGVVARSREALGVTVGRLYLVNTVAGVLSSLVGGFVLLTVLGGQRLLVLTVVVLAALGAAGAGRLAGRLRVRLAAASLAVLSLLLCLPAPPWSEVLFNAGAAYRFGRGGFDSRLELERFLVNSPSRLVSLAEGSDATVAVRHGTWTTTMIINGKPDASSGEDMPTQSFLGLLPGLLHGAVERAFVVGYGSGVTAHAIASFPTVREVEVVELEREVVRAGRHFSDVNGELHSNARVRVVIDDARSRLQGTRTRYDVIISEPSNLHLAGTANLFTSEMYALARQRLRPGGIFAQWVHLYRLQGPVLGVVLRTLSEAFPHVQVWAVDDSNLAILCTEQPLPPDPSVWEARIASNPYLRQSLQRWWRVERPAELLGHYLLDPALVQHYVQALQPSLHTDDEPVLEFQALREAYGPRRRLIGDIWRTRLALGRAVPAALRGRVPGATILASAATSLKGHKALRRELTQAGLLAARAAQAAGDRETGESAARLAAAWLQMDDGQPASALRELDAVGQALRDDPRAGLLRGKALASLGRLEQAQEVLGRLPERLQVESELTMAAAEERAGRAQHSYQRRLSVLEGLQAGRWTFHSRLPVQTLFADLQRLAKRLGRWEPLMQRLRDERLDPRGEIPRRAGLSAALVAQGRFAEALQELLTLERSFDVVDVRLHRMSVRCLLELGRAEEAAQRWQRLLELDPAQAPSPLRLKVGGIAAGG